jgi:hypothetical protein
MMHGKPDYCLNAAIGCDCFVLAHLMGCALRAGGERVARDLFKEHFSSLSEAGPPQAPEAAMHLRTSDLRQSLSAM